MQGRMCIATIFMQKKIGQVEDFIGVLFDEKFAAF